MNGNHGEANDAWRAELQYDPLWRAAVVQAAARGGSSVVGIVTQAIDHAVQFEEQLMQIERLNRAPEFVHDTGAPNVIARTMEALDDPEVTKITITPNRHERRKQAKLGDTSRQARPVRSAQPGEDDSVLD